MKKLYAFLLFSMGLSTAFNYCNAQTIVEADVLVASTPDFIQANLLVDGNASNYGYLSAKQIFRSVILLLYWMKKQNCLLKIPL